MRRSWTRSFGCQRAARPEAPPATGSRSEPGATHPAAAEEDTVRTRVYSSYPECFSFISYEWVLMRMNLQRRLSRGFVARPGCNLLYCACVLTLLWNKCAITGRADEIKSTFPPPPQKNAPTFMDDACCSSIWFQILSSSISVDTRGSDEFHLWLQTLLFGSDICVHRSLGSSEHGGGVWSQSAVYLAGYPACSGISDLVWFTCDLLSPSRPLD